jgi:predicted Zn-dependent protease
MEHGGDKEKALQLAQTAKEMAPEEPHISDTLGWILYKRGVYQRALSLLSDSAAKLPENPEIQYHLGMAYLKAGDKEGAKKALTLAATSQTGFVGKEEAKRALTDLK